MSVKMKKIKVCHDEVPNLEEHKNANSIRIKSRYNSNLPIIKEWVDSVDVNIINNTIMPTTKIFWKEPKPYEKPKAGEVAKPPELPLPSELRGFVDYMLEESRIPMDEVRGYMFHVIKPLNNYTKESIKNTPIINIKQCMAFISDRFVMFGGSNEQLMYKTINMDQIKKSIGMGNISIPEKFYDNVSENSVSRMDLTIAIANILQVNNEKSYPRPHRKGFRDGITVKKDPYKRWILIFDVIATTIKVNSVLREKIDMMGNIMNTNPNSTEAKIIRSFKPEKLDKDIQKDTKEIGEEDEDVEDVEIPELVTIPDNKATMGNEVLDDL
jgi:hypothetical protein